MPLYDRDSSSGHVSSTVALVSRIGTISVTQLHDTSTQSLVIGRDTFWRHRLDTTAAYDGPSFFCYSAYAKWPLPFLIANKVAEALGMPAAPIDEWRKDLRADAPAG